MYISDYSAADCSTDWNSCPAGQACTGFGIGHGATGPTSLEMACIGNGGFTSQNQPIPATGNLGDSCDITFSNDNGVYCNSNYCLPDAGADQGYCSELCTSNADCAGGSPDMICDDYVLLDRKDDADDVTIGLCRKQKSCVSCVADTDCAGNYVCVNAGGVGLLADYRCAPPCSAAGDDASCAGTDGGNTCSESVNADGSGEGVFACVPGNC